MFPKRALIAVFLCAAGGLRLGDAALAETCSPEKFAAAIDGAGAALRRFNGEAQPKLKEKLRALQAKKSWKDDRFEEQGYAYLQDERIDAFDAEANELLTDIDDLGRPEGAGPSDCAALATLESKGARLLAVMGAKTAYMISKIDKELGAAPANDVGAGVPKPPSALSKPEAKSPASVAEPAPASPTSEWSIVTSPVPGPPADPMQPEAPLSATLTNDEAGYTIDEIREATRGFFGAISTNLASVLEHAFSVSGRPTAYVLGKEGGGAFLAGVRYGEGTLFLRGGGKQKVYWHGPSLGTDIGAEGSRTLFLIYKLNEPQDLFRSFTGVDGSAYFVGGVGVTLMKGGRVLMAPIRSGLGLRLGANIGYVRFTARPTWNPF